MVNKFDAGGRVRLKKMIFVFIFTHWARFRRNFCRRGKRRLLRALGRPRGGCILFFTHHGRPGMFARRPLAIRRLRRRQSRAVTKNRLLVFLISLVSCFCHYIAASILISRPPINNSANAFVIIRTNTGMLVFTHTPCRNG
jgi:hypothetical protein